MLPFKNKYNLSKKAILSLCLSLSLTTFFLSSSNASQQEIEEEIYNKIYLPLKSRFLTSIPQNINDNTQIETRLTLRILEGDYLTAPTSEEIKQLYKQGNTHFVKGGFPQAENVFKKMAEAGHLTGIQCLSLVYKKLGRAEEAELYHLLQEEFSFIDKGEFDKKLLSLPEKQIRRSLVPLLEMALHKNVNAQKLLAKCYYALSLTSLKEKEKNNASSLKWLLNALETELEINNTVTNLEWLKRLARKIPEGLYFFQEFTDKIGEILNLKPLPSNLNLSANPAIVEILHSAANSIFNRGNNCCRFQATSFLTLEELVSKRVRLTTSMIEKLKKINKSYPTTPLYKEIGYRYIELGDYRETLEEKDKYFKRAEYAFAAINNFDKYTFQIDILCQPAIRSSLSINERLNKADRIIAILKEAYPQEEKISLLKAEVLLARAHLLGGEEAKSLYKQGAALLEKQTPTPKICSHLIGLYFDKKIGTELSPQQRESKIRELIKIFPAEEKQLIKIMFYYEEGFLGANLTRIERDKKCWHLCNLSNQGPFTMAQLLLNSKLFNSEETTEIEREKNIYQAATILKNEYLRTNDKEMLSLLGDMYFKRMLGKNLQKEIVQDIAYTFYSIANGKPNAKRILDLVLLGFKPAPRLGESLEEYLVHLCTYSGDAESFWKLATAYSGGLIGEKMSLKERYMEVYDLLLIAKLKGLFLLPAGDKFKAFHEAVEDMLQCLHGGETSSHQIKPKEEQEVNTAEFLLSKQEEDILIKAEESILPGEEKEVSPIQEDSLQGEGTTTSSPKEIKLRKKENKLEKKKRKIAKLQAEIKASKEDNTQEVVNSKPLEIVFNPLRLEEEMKVILKKGDLKARNLQQQLEEVFFYRWQLKGAGQPEVLKHTQGITVFSRRITLEHRLVYSLSGNTLTIYAIEGHY